MPLMMKLVYQLSKDLQLDPEQVADAQALTLDQSRPNIGLKGTSGLFGSAEWWANISAGVMPVKRIAGFIERTYVAGQDRLSAPNTFDMRMTSGEMRMEGIYTNLPEDVALYRPGRKVEVVYVLDELKGTSPDGGARYSEIVLEVSVELP
jgi:hypothetical protein